MPHHLAAAAATYVTHAVAAVVQQSLSSLPHLTMYVVGSPIFESLAVPVN